MLLPIYFKKVLFYLAFSSFYLGMMSKREKVEKYYLSPTGTSDLIARYDLPVGLAYTSGDGPFRSESPLGMTYKFFRFSPTLDFKKTSRCWNLTDEDKLMITEIHKTHFTPAESGTTVKYIQFFGKADVDLEEDLPRNDIKSVICKRKCANCGTTTDIQCDHKNDLKNDPRVLNRETQTLDDFQALCRHCNCVKREVKKKMLRTNKRYSAIELGYAVGFTIGDETLDQSKTDWYIGTYWGDCLAFKVRLNLNLTVS